MKEMDILYEAFYNLEKNIPLVWELRKGNYTNNNDLGIDGEINLTINREESRMFVDIKREVKNHQLLNIIECNKKFENFLLVAERLYPKIKAELRNNNVNYLECNGNAYIKNHNLFLFIDNRKTIKAQKERGNRAFTKTGLKVVFHFLTDNELLNQTQREIAEKTNVALGNIPLIINGLLENNFILKLNKNEYLINDYIELLNKWGDEFAQTLKPVIFKQRFRFQDLNQNWKTLNLDTKKTVWGGEPAGDIITNHLRPENFILYTKETTRDLMLNYRLVPDENGNIWVYDMFWNNTMNNITPKELVYTDLILNNDKRSNETAKLIFDEYIKPNL